MEEQTSWKGHTFTLMIFGGIVVLCSIFFVLGMLVGRTQNVKIGTVASADTTPAKPQIKEAQREDLPEREPRFDPIPEKPAPAPPTPVPPAAAAVSKPARSEDPVPAQPAVTINLQVTALQKQSDAEKQVDVLKRKGFRAFMLAPQPNDPKPVYRVQVGAADSIEAESLKQQLEAAGFKPFIKPK